MATILRDAVSQRICSLGFKISPEPAILRANRSFLKIERCAMAMIIARSKRPTVICIKSGSGRNCHGPMKLKIELIAYRPMKVRAAFAIICIFVIKRPFLGSILAILDDFDYTWGLFGCTEEFRIENVEFRKKLRKIGKRLHFFGLSVIFLALRSLCRME